MSTHEQEIKSAVDCAKMWAKDDGLFPSVNEYGEERYYLQPALKAACHGREDAAAILIIQQHVLRRLEHLRVLAMIGLALLGYIAVRLS